MTFEIDNRLIADSFSLGDWPLSHVLLKNNAHFPWLILVPRIENVQEIEQLAKQSQHILMDEISQLSTIVRTYFNADKLNIGALGNIVNQLHVHVVGRSIKDPLWPHGIWQKEQPVKSYPEDVLKHLVTDLQNQIKTCESV